MTSTMTVLILFCGSCSTCPAKICSHISEMNFDFENRNLEVSIPFFVLTFCFLHSGEARPCKRTWLWCTLTIGKSDNKALWSNIIWLKSFSRVPWKRWIIGPSASACWNVQLIPKQFFSGNDASRLWSTQRSKCQRIERRRSTWGEWSCPAGHTGPYGALGGSWGRCSGEGWGLGPKGVAKHRDT